MFTLSCSMAFAQSTQPPIRILDPTNPAPMPSDVRMMQFDVPVGATWRVFGVDRRASESHVAEIIKTAAARLPVP
jgi:hypothetical protein